MEVHLIEMTKSDKISLQHSFDKVINPYSQNILIV